MSKVPTVEVIKVSAYITDTEGYVKKSDSESNCTVNRVIDVIELGSLNEEESESIKDRVANWLNYVNDENNSSEYFVNLRSEIAKPMIEETKIGLIASSFASYDRHAMYKKKNDTDKQSEFLGEEGDSVTFTISEYKLVKVGQSKYNRESGKYYLYKIKDNNGNVVMWFADHDCEYEFSKSDEATATITKLSTFNEVKQTNVSKLRFL